MLFIILVKIKKINVLSKFMITFVIPTHNYAKFLRKSISSIKNNPKFIKEIIIVNDGSTDNTDDVVDDLKKSETEILQKEF